MNRSNLPQADSRFDLFFERIVDVPRERIWSAWTTPEQIKLWFTPDPWKTVDCEIDLRPGGIFRTVMRSPEGQEFPNVGCYLEIVENEKLVWTNALGPGFRPSRGPSGDSSSVDFAFTAVISLEAQGNGTKYMATVIHGNETDRAKHDAMGFHEGWGKALDQLVAMIKR
jgi:uncharacterized protein YndB with AHSA1/START domain